MQEVNTSLAAVNVSALDTALRAALPGKALGISTYGPARPISVWLADSSGPTDHAAALAVCAAHDPVTISPDKLAVTANGVDAVTITVTAQPTGASVTLVITQPGGGQQVQAVTTPGGVGTLVFTTTIPGVYTFALQAPANRCNDVITVTAT